MSTSKKQFSSTLPNRIGKCALTAQNPAKPKAQEEKACPPKSAKICGGRRRKQKINPSTYA
jgi:hypothetical protein